MSKFQEIQRLVHLKQKARRAKAASSARSKVAALPRIQRINLNANYVNPITLNFPSASIVVYEVKNKQTGRTNYYDKKTFWGLLGRTPSNYNLLMMNPKAPIPGVRNPVTRNPIYPRNVRRVTVAAKKTPSPNTAAKKIQSAVRKHLSKKRATAKSKTPVKAKSPNKRKSPSPNKRKTPSPNKSKSKSKSRSK